MNLNSLEDASVSDVAQLLQNGGIPSDTIDMFTGELAHAQHCLALTASYVYHLLVYTCIREWSGWTSFRAVDSGCPRVLPIGTPSRLTPKSEVCYQKGIFCYTVVVRALLTH